LRDREREREREKRNTHEVAKLASSVFANNEIKISNF